MYVLSINHEFIGNMQRNISAHSTSKCVEVCAYFVCQLLIIINYLILKYVFIILLLKDNPNSFISKRFKLEAMRKTLPNLLL